jgi:uncharacterized protein YeaO (DUF488 family)
MIGAFLAKLGIGSGRAAKAVPGAAAEMPLFEAKPDVQAQEAGAGSSITRGIQSAEDPLDGPKAAPSTKVAELVEKQGDEYRDFREQKNDELHKTFANAQESMQREIAQGEAAAANKRRAAQLAAPAASAEKGASVSARLATRSAEPATEARAPSRGQTL